MEQHSTSMALIESSQAQIIPLQETGEDGKVLQSGSANTAVKREHYWVARVVGGS